MAKLTEAQRRALEAMPFSYMTWGGKVLGSLPDGVRSRVPLYALRDKGFASCRLGGRERWDITEAGRATLSKGDTHD